MARVKRAVNAHKKRRETLELASGYRGQRSRLYRKAKEQVLHSATYQYRDRKKRKGDFRQLWIQRINAAARLNGMTYNRFMQGLKIAGDRGGPQGPGRPGRHRRAGLRRARRAARGRPAGRRAGAGRPGRRLSQPGPTSTRSPRVQAVRRLHRRSARVAERRFVVEGPQAVREALAAGGLHELFSPHAAGELQDAARAAGTPVTVVPGGGARGDGRDGLAAGRAGRRRRCSTTSPDRLPDRPRLVAVLDAVERPRQRRDGAAHRRRRRRRRGGVHRGLDRPARRQVRPGLGRQPVAPAGRDRTGRRWTRSPRCGRAGVAVLATSGARRGRPRRPASTPGRSPAPPPGCSAPRRTACRPRSSRPPTGGSGSRSTAAPSRSTCRPPPRSACTPRPEPSGADAAGRARPGRPKRSNGTRDLFPGSVRSYCSG